MGCSLSNIHPNFASQSVEHFMKFFPESTLHQLEFDKIKELLAAHCRTEYAKTKALQLRIHTKIGFIHTELLQANEFKIILQSGEYFPNDFPINILSIFDKWFRSYIWNISIFYCST